MAIPGAMAQAAQSPEGFGVEATGLFNVDPTPLATAANPSPASVASAGITGFFTVNAISAQVSGNTTTASIAGVTALGGSPISVSAGAISSSCSVSSSGAFTESSSIGNLTVPGLTIPANPAPNTTLTIPLVGSVTLNEQGAGPTGGSATVTAVHFHYLTGEDVYIASSTCGPYIAAAAMASGAGLAVGLGGIGVLGVTGVAVTWRRRRQQSASA
ncbi:MAG TPA: choice-of-anchor P family protein [Trebonia sp.]|nr:choice-of-anchor P family protein [Trebonia sp.]